MTKKRAKEVLIAHACCMLGDNMCKECPWNNTEDCKDTAFVEVLEEAIFTMKGEKFMKMKLSDIKITSAFEKSVPSERKMEECRKNWDNFQIQDRYLVVNRTGYLVDGYVMYCVLKENGVEEAKVKISDNRKKGYGSPYYKTNPTTYIYGVHPNSNCTKEFVWRVPASWKGWENNVQNGDMIMCVTKNGYASVVVTKVETLDKCPVNMAVKKVARKEIRRNGEVIKV